MKQPKYLLDNHIHRSPKVHSINVPSPCGATIIGVSAITSAIGGTMCLADYFYHIPCPNNLYFTTMASICVFGTSTIILSLNAVQDHRIRIKNIGKKC